MKTASAGVGEGVMEVIRVWPEGQGMISDGPASMLPVNRKVDKCEIWLFLHLTAVLHYGCAQITRALPVQRPHERWRWLT